MSSIKHGEISSCDIVLPEGNLHIWLIRHEIHHPIIILFANRSWPVSLQIWRHVGWTWTEFLFVHSAPSKRNTSVSENWWILNQQKSNKKNMIFSLWIMNLRSCIFCEKTNTRKRPSEKNHEIRHQEKGMNFSMGIKKVFFFGESFQPARLPCDVLLVLSVGSFFSWLQWVVWAGDDGST